MAEVTGLQFENLTRHASSRTAVCAGKLLSLAQMAGDGCPHVDCDAGYFRSNKSPATKTKNTTEITPFMVKNAAFSLDRLVGETRECS
jgi:hypothetical protein